MTPMKAIRLKCLDCCCGSSYEVAKCDITRCSLHIYRFGHNPRRRGVGNTKAILPTKKSVIELGV